MLFLFFWIGFSAVVAVAANTRGRSAVAWFFLALLCPLVVGLILLALPRVAGEDLIRKRPCPFCAEPIRLEATICPHCRSQLPVADLASERDYPEVYKGVRYRREQDGSVVMATANGPRRFSKWEHFWSAINDIVVGAASASTAGPDIAMKPAFGKAFGNRHRPH